jgi:hypothetical protein
VNVPIWHPICQRGVAKEEKVSKFGKTKWSCQRGKKKSTIWQNKVELAKTRKVNLAK